MNVPMIAQRMMYGINNFLLLAIPLFILAARLMNTSGVTTRLFNFATTMVGFLPGGLGHANCVASLIFAGMSGAAVADAAGLGQVELKAMDEAGYDREFSVAVTARLLDDRPHLPAQHPHGDLRSRGGVSVGRLFLGGVVPGRADDRSPSWSWCGSTPRSAITRGRPSRPRAIILKSLALTPSCRS